MGLDIFVYYMKIPVLLICLILSLSFIVIGKPWESLPKQFTHLSMQRIIRGLAGVLVACLILSVTQAWYGRKAISYTLLGDALYIAILFIPLIFLVFTLAGLTLLNFLAKSGRATISNILLLSICFALIWAAFIAYKPYNNWCAANTAICAMRAFLHAASLSALTGLGFGLFAQLPFRRKHS